MLISLFKFNFGKLRGGCQQVRLSFSGSLYFFGGQVGSCVTVKVQAADSSGRVFDSSQVYCLFFKIF